MKRCNENLFNHPMDLWASVPLDTFSIIHQHLLPESRVALSQVDQYRRKACSDLVKSICFTSPKEFSIAPSDIYLRLIKRYTNIQKLTFKSLCRSASLFDIVDTHYKINTLIEFLKAQKDHPLSHVPEIHIEEIAWCGLLDENSGSKKEHFSHIARHTNLAFIKAVSHPKLASLSIELLKQSALRGPDIQSILENGIELKHFQIKGIASGEDYPMFALVKSQKLESLVLPPCKNLKSVFVDEMYPNLKRLEIDEVNLDEFEFALKTPNLEYLKTGYIYPEESDDFSDSWTFPNLKELHIGGMDLSIDEFPLTNWPNLKIFTLRTCLWPSELSLFDMPELECLNLADYSYDSDPGTEDFCLNFPKLKELLIGDLGIYQEESIHLLFKGLSNLELIDITNASSLTKVFPNLERCIELIKIHCPKINDVTQDNHSKRVTFFSKPKIISSTNL